MSSAKTGSKTNGFCKGDNFINLASHSGAMTKCQTETQDQKLMVLFNKYFYYHIYMITIHYKSKS